ncbi:zinc finger BED domain-containing protein 5-like [Euwallacea similis]|uniref:zinc finger BED domain-containing protein 5-like n=1 Tax=Euwallacea similis TaxID=1736056 RepID=UPI00344C372A
MNYDKGRYKLLHLVNQRQCSILGEMNGEVNVEVSGESKAPEMLLESSRQVTKLLEISGLKRRDCSMKRNKLKRFLEMLHKELLAVNKEALMTSDKVAYKAAKCKKSHTFVKQLILPSCKDILETIIVDIQRQLESELTGKLFAIQLDKAADFSNDSHLIRYIRYCQGSKIYEDLLFCKLIEGRTTATELFKIANDAVTKANLHWKNCVAICTDEVHAMSKITWKLCMIHREALASKSINPGLNMVVIEVVNFIKTSPLKSRMFSVLCEDMEADRKSLLFYSSSRWLSCGKVVKLVIGLRKEIAILLSVEGYKGSAKFYDISFLLRLSYLELKENCFETFPALCELIWVSNPFDNTPVGLSLQKEEPLKDVSTTTSQKLNFVNKSLTHFCTELPSDYFFIKAKALRILLPFPTSYLCETGFSALASLKPKYRNKLQVENELKVTAFNIEANLKRLCALNQAHRPPDYVKAPPLRGAPHSLRTAALGHLRPHAEWPSLLQAAHFIGSVDLHVVFFVDGEVTIYEPYHEMLGFTKFCKNILEISIFNLLATNQYESVIKRVVLIW